jgi:membrane-associated phospholipid phosphatase
MTTWRAALASIGLALAWPAAASGQQTSAPAVGAPTDSSVRRGTLLTTRDVVAAGLIGAATVALLPVDQQIAEEFRDPSPQRSTLLHDGAKTFDFLGDPGALFLSVGAYGAGRLAHSPRLADIGLHTTEAIVVSGAVTGILKGAFGRQRPYVAGHDPHDFKFGRGYGNGAYASMPSGHTTAAFATAAALTEEARHWWPRSPWIVGPVLYGGAAMVGMARMYDDKHWASDVMLGAGVGTLSSLVIVRYVHSRPTNRVDRWLGVSSLVPSVAPGPGGGGGLAWRVTTR